MVTAEGARRYGVVVCEAAGGRAATAALRDRLRAARPAELPVFDMGPPLDELLERCEEETGLPAPKRPVLVERVTVPITSCTRRWTS